MNATQHLRLLQRTGRALMLKRAIFEVVRPGHVVLDAGCGSGILSVWAAQAGASRVVAVDCDDLSLAQAIAEANGVADCIRFLRQDLREDLPQEFRQGCQVVVAMIYLNDPRRDEPQSTLAFELRDRYLAAGGMMIPDRVEYEASGWEWPQEDHAARARSVTDRVRAVGNELGLQLDPLRERVLGRPDSQLFPSRAADGTLPRPDARRLTSEETAIVVDYSGSAADLPDRIELQCEASGVLHALLWRQRLMWKRETLFTNESVSWFDPPVAVEVGLRSPALLGAPFRRANLVTLGS